MAKTIPPHAVEIIRLIKSGDSPKKIKHKLGVRGCVIRYWAKKFGVPAFKRGFPKEEPASFLKRVDKMKNMRIGSGMTLKEIGNQFSVSRERVRQMIGNTGKRFRGDRIASIIASTPERERQRFTSGNPLFNSSQSMWSAHISKYHHAISGGTAKVGQLAERMVSTTLSQSGIPNQLMPIGYKFDILISSSNKRIDVKFSEKPYKNSNCKSPQWRFKSRSNRSNSDFFICVLGETGVWFIIPTHRIPKGTSFAFCWPTLRPEIHKFSDCEFIPSESNAEKINHFFEKRVDSDS